MDSTIAKRNSFVGTPYWMSPEVIQRKEYDGRADVWSLGICAMEIAELVPPHSEVHPMRVLFKIIRDPSPKLKDKEAWCVFLFFCFFFFFLFSFFLIVCSCLAQVAEFPRLHRQMSDQGFESQAHCQRAPQCKKPTKEEKKTRQQSKFNLDVFRSLQHKFMNTASGKEEMVKVITKTKKIVEERGYGLYDDEAEGLVV